MHASSPKILFHVKIKEEFHKFQILGHTTQQQFYRNQRHNNSTQSIVNLRRTNYKEAIRRYKI